MSRAGIVGPGLRLRLLAARLQQWLGWPGVAGLVLLALALGLGWSAWQPTEAEPSDLVEAVQRDIPRPAPVDAPAAARGKLPARTEIQALLAQIQQAAVASGLGWPAAEYRLSPATGSDAAALEVRCTLKGTYPQLRSLLTRLLAEVPGLGLRELSVTRPGSEVPEIEVQLVLAIFLQGDQAASPGQGAP